MARMFDQPSVGNTLILCALSWVLVFATLQVGGSFFVSSELRTIIGGAVGSLLFFFAITVTGTTSVLFSIASMWYINHMSQKISDKAEAAQKPVRK
eukprot:gene6568-7615_t